MRSLQPSVAAVAWRRAPGPRTLPFPACSGSADTAAVTWQPIAPLLALQLHGPWFAPTAWLPRRPAVPDGRQVPDSRGPGVGATEATTDRRPSPAHDVCRTHRSS